MEIREVMRSENDPIIPENDEAGEYYLPQDTVTSRIETTPRHRASSMTMRLLRAFKTAGRKGLSAEEACIQTNMERGGWKRVSDLQRLGYLEFTGKKTTGTYDVDQQVRRITPAGRQALKTAR